VCLSLQGQRDLSLSVELTQVADGFACRVRTFSRYDVNGYHFCTTSYDQSRPNQKTMCSEVFMVGLDEVEVYIIEYVSNFTITYYGNKLPSVHNPPLIRLRK
jgi:hypothetical protein